MVLGMFSTPKRYCKLVGFRTNNQGADSLFPSLNLLSYNATNCKRAESTTYPSPTPFDSVKEKSPFVIKPITFRQQDSLIVCVCGSQRACSVCACLSVISFVGGGSFAFLFLTTTTCLSSADTSCFAADSSSSFRFSLTLFLRKRFSNFLCSVRSSLRSVWYSSVWSCSVGPVSLGFLDMLSTSASEGRQIMAQSAGLPLPHIWIVTGTRQQSVQPGNKTANSGKLQAFWEFCLTFFTFRLLITAFRHSSFFLFLKTKNLILHEEDWFSVLDDMTRFSVVLCDQSLTRTSQEQMNGLVMPSFTWFGLLSGGNL